MVITKREFFFTRDKFVPLTGVQKRTREIFFCRQLETRICRKINKNAIWRRCLVLTTAQYQHFLGFWIMVPALVLRYLRAGGSLYTVSTYVQQCSSVYNLLLQYCISM
jgi:hypothetical protein